MDTDELQDTWLTPNGVDGLIPERAEIVVKGGQVTFPAWHHLDGTVGGWGRDVRMEADDIPNVAHDDPRWGVPVTSPRTVPLRVPVTARVRELFARSTLTLVER